jgi:hypothetical protein
VETAEVLNSTVKKNEVMSFAGKWMDLKIMLSEINQAQKAKYHIPANLWKLD